MGPFLKLCARGAIAASILTAGGSLQSSFGQTTVAGSSIALNSYALGPGSALMTGPGYLATYLDVTDSGDGGSMINLTLNATRGAGGAGVDPHMNIVIADSKFGFTVANTSATNYGTGDFWLPAGKYVVRSERDSPNNPTSSTRTATVNDLSVGAVTGAATFNNSNSNANALAAADNYIANFRRGPATVNINGVAAGTSVTVTQVQDAFGFGANINGTATSILSNTQYTDFYKSHFNTMVPSRMGKWNNQESTRDTVTMAGLDAYMDFAQTNGMKIRMHNLVWNNEQPAYSNTMLTTPAGTDTYNAGTNPQGTNLSNSNALYSALLAPGGTPNAGEPSEVHERIAYYVGDGPGGFEDQAPRFQEIDIYNESYHTGVDTVGSNNWWDRYGATGIAQMYEDVKTAIAISGGSGKTYVNEYNALNTTSGPTYDNYANWYRNHIELIENADSDAADQTIGGIGIQYWAEDDHAASRMQQAIQNLSVTGLPLTLSEHGVQGPAQPNGLPSNDPLSRQIVTETLRMVYGNPNFTTHMIWGFWEGARDAALQGGFSLTEADWDLTSGGEDYEDLRGLADHDGNPNNGWRTNESLTVNSNGEIEFNGFYGDYIITINGDDYLLSLVKGTTDYQLTAISDDGDFNDDGNVDDQDIDILWNVIRPELAGDQDPNNNDDEDLNGDGFVNEDDVDYMLANLLDAGPDRSYGDADLDGGVGGLDYTAWRLRAGTGWANGDFDGDGGVGGLDYTLWRTRPTTYPSTVGQHGSGPAIVPEPSTLALTLLGASAFCLAMRRRITAGFSGIGPAASGTEN